MGGLGDSHMKGVEMMVGGPFSSSSTSGACRSKIKMALREILSQAYEQLMRAKLNPELCTFRITEFHLETHLLFLHFQFESDSSSGCILLLYSVILSRSIRK